MTLSLLAPLFMAGVGLLVLPWYIHHIRRPEREPIPFSSLMFVPKVEKQVIERWRLQHLLLLLLRMLLFILLVLAFMRPALESLLDLGALDDGPGHHVILLDTSYSMGTLGRFEEAKTAALDIIESLDASDNVAIIAFDERPRLLAPLIGEDPDTGSAARATQAVQGATLTERGTSYYSALRRAEELLVVTLQGDEPPTGKRVVHVISDFQHGGMPLGKVESKLSRWISFESVEIGEAGTVNHSITDLDIRALPSGEMTVLAQIKNWSVGEEHPLEVRLMLGGDDATATNMLSVRPRNASQTAFTIPMTEEDSISGWVEIDVDALDIDNRRYFSWNPRRSRRALLVADEQTGQRWSASTFLSHAIRGAGGIPWTLEVVSQEGLTDFLADATVKPDVLLACDLNGIVAATANTISTFAQEGGQVLLALNATMDQGAVNDILRPALGVSSDGLRFSNTEEAQFDLLSWFDLDSAVFLPFSGSRFNDFSSIRFFNYHRLTLPASGTQTTLGKTDVLARFEGDDANPDLPAIIELEIGEGRVMLWSFGVDLGWSTLPKSARFLPIIHETLSHLAGLGAPKRHLKVGAGVSRPTEYSSSDGVLTLRAPGSDEASPFVEEPGFTLERAGIAAWSTSGTTSIPLFEAVNIDSLEADPTRITPAEFALKLCASPILTQDALAEFAEGDFDAAPVQQHEYGHFFIIAFFALLLCEGWYACKLTS